MASLNMTAPAASAEVTSLSISGDRAGEINDWNIAAVTDDCAPVWFYDNGTLISDEPVVPVNPGYDFCRPNNNFASIGWLPTTKGVHHIVVEQRNAAGQVVSSISEDYFVEKVPCRSGTGSACQIASGSA
ncbi:hypothetical protein ABZ319_03380 [Nocardia sp. NPDC005978]|uniref:hypothetical protein n=1 Tax=Nocardia sp. NPDC005978 TaxID=3156725 RepID=UPI0033B93F1B